MTAPAAAVSLYPQVDIPEDPGLPDLAGLFDPDWVWGAVRDRLAESGVAPRQLRVRQFSHSPGRAAVVSYVAEWEAEAFIPPRLFTLRLRRGQAFETSHYPEDSDLPGLAEAADPETALRLMNKHVFGAPRRRMRVDMVRYRPGSRAVLRHRTGKNRFYVRVVRPGAMPALLEAGELTERSTFVVPRVVGYWGEGGVLWLSEIPGANVRQRMRRGKPPDPEVLLDSLESLWAVPHEGARGRPFDLKGAYRRARRTFRYALRDSDEGLRLLGDATQGLDSFVESWQPSTTAHNDFYDDQILLLPDGRVAVVDFEETGPGDPFLDVGNFLAHHRWASSLGRHREADASGAYYHRFRDAAIERFNWNASDLALREAVCLFRICTNTVRHLRTDWRQNTLEGLALTNEMLR